MGVPFFMGQFQRNHPDIVVHERPALDILFTDTNGLIHPECRRIMEENPDIKDRKELEYVMARAVVQKIRELVKYANVKQLSIKIDGPCPRAKIKQQRLRRFKSMLDRKLENSIRAKWNVPTVESKWDTCAITPGTGFMRRLAVLIEIKMRKGYFGEDVQVDFSSAEEPGEGEHKILAHIRKIVAECRKSGKETPRIAVHGLDADLIFLMMSSECPNIFLMREMEEIDRKQRGNKQIAFVNMDRFTHYVLKSIEPPPDNTPIDCIRDWIAICYFLGNDFLPAFPSLSVKNHALDALVNCYNLTKRRLVVRDGKMWSLDTVTLTNLAQVLAVDEVTSISKYPRARPNQRPWTYNSFEQEWEAINKVREPVRDTIMVGVGSESQWKFRYYSRFFKTDSMRDVHKMCHEYHKGLVWVINYYLGKCPSWSWFYPGEYAPFLSDFAKTDLASSEIEFELGMPTTPQQQLLLCLPVTSSWLIPKQYRSLVEADGVLNDLYPTECEDELLWKSNLWQGIPHLPAFDPERVLREAARIDDPREAASSSSSSTSTKKKRSTN